MKRVLSTPRPDWREKIEAQGLIFSTSINPDGKTTEYWNEGAFYEFELDEVEMLENVTEELHRMCIEAAKFLAKGSFGDLGIGRPALKMAAASLERGDFDVYGRFDFAYDGVNPPKMLEYNADTPTGLIEAALAQWNWLEETMPEMDQWNSIHEALVKRWAQLRGTAETTPMLHVTHAEVEGSGEDWMTAAYIMDTANKGGWDVQGINISDIGWNSESNEFCDLDERKIEHIFKLYPWEQLMAEEFGANAREYPTSTQWVEPAWKMLLSTKALLAALWHLYPGHPNLLPTYMDSPRHMTEWVAKPLHGREGDNIRINAGDIQIEQPGDYGAEGWVYQAWHPLADFDGNRPVLGSWTVGGESVGVGIRESDGPVTDYYCRFVPNVINAPAPWGNA